MKVNEVLNRCPWTLVFLVKLKDLGGEASASEIAKEISVKSPIVKRAMWWLRKYGFVEEVSDVEPRRFRLRTEAYRFIEKLVVNMWVKGNTTVILWGRTYYVFIVRESRVIVKTVSKEVVDEARKLKIEIRQAKVKDISDSLGVPMNLASVVLRVLKTTS